MDVACWTWCYAGHDIHQEAFYNPKDFSPHCQHKWCMCMQTEHACTCLSTHTSSRKHVWCLGKWRYDSKARMSNNSLIFFFSVFVCAYNFRGHTLLSIVSHGLSPSYFLRQELATLARLVGHWVPGIKLCFPIAGITGRCCWTCIIIVIIILVNVASEAWIWVPKLSGQAFNYLYYPSQPNNSLKKMFNSFPSGSNMCIWDEVKTVRLGIRFFSKMHCAWSVIMYKSTSGTTIFSPGPSLPVVSKQSITLKKQTKQQKSLQEIPPVHTLQGLF